MSYDYTCSVLVSFHHNSMRELARFFNNSNLLWLSFGSHMLCCNNNTAVNVPRKRLGFKRLSIFFVVENLVQNEFFTLTYAVGIHFKLQLFELYKSTLSTFTHYIVNIVLKVWRVKLQIAILYGYIDPRLYRVYPSCSQ